MWTLAIAGNDTERERQAAFHVKQCPNHAAVRRVIWRVGDVVTWSMAPRHVP